MLKNNNPILIMAGGTGGHIYPGIAVARALIAKGIPVVWLGTRKGLEAKVVPASGIPIQWMNISGFRKKGIIALFLAPVRLLFACYQAARVIAKVKPCLILGMGGFVAGPGGIVCKLMHKPLVIHEQNAIAGLTNRFLSLIANSVLQAFPGTFKPHINAYHTGNPVREDITTLADTTIRRLSENKGSLKLLIIGGSLGANFLNKVVPQAIATMPADMCPIVHHQAGNNYVDSTKELYSSFDINADVSAFLDNIAEEYAWADLVICRSGAMTVAELAAVGLPSILVPYPHAVDDHQTVNAKFLASKNAAILAPQSELTATLLGDWLGELTVDRQRLLKMAKSAQSVARPEATQLVVRECLAVAESF